MKHINEDKIKGILDDIAGKSSSDKAVDQVLAKSLDLKRLSVEETAVLLGADDSQTDKILNAARTVKHAIYGKRVVLFAPLYLSNICANNCVYCAFRLDNKDIPRKRLSQEEVSREIHHLLKTGHKRLLVVSGEDADEKRDVEYLTGSIKTIYAQREGKDSIRRVNVNCAPLSKENFVKLKGSAIGTYQLFQETYHDQTYREVHPAGPKSDPDKRLDAIDLAFSAGIDDIGVGVLFGLYDHKYEILAMLTHVEYLEKTFNVGPHTISVPRIEPAAGSAFSTNVPYAVSDPDFKKIVAVLRLSVPYTGLILSTRETAEMRDELFDLGISQASAASRTTPGGYEEGEVEHCETDGQFSLNDHRSLDQVIGALISRGTIPSFCTACYRSDRTGEKFMNLARPGTIKGKCSMNALITLKEYLDDFASEEVKKKGYNLIDDLKKDINQEDVNRISSFFEEIDRGKRDLYV